MALHFLIHLLYFLETFHGKQLQLFCAQLAEIRLKDNAFSVLGSEELMQDPGADD